ncbi:hypothetical protein ZOSMA_2006G00030 [Zostera marina]|uniref:Uncharacterized protein n=1 Tax=Zostera marina TaxID=29655 RepID=A0A0K9PM23_ZOSMR|nr:hypothetical protein ZOSMA_2006G00030 [Zostera marina]
MKDCFLAGNNNEAQQCYFSWPFQEKMAKSCQDMV